MAKDSLDSTGEDTFAITVKETFSIYSGDGEEYTKSFKNTYMVKRIYDEFLITDLKVSENETEV
ncbi:TcaA NTF2-like domain-containing protein [Peribacillus tepidiphilus]|uniref:TcaA NTF2-like domain-containing protein n=1 Tax=Peribacillus tepidiphilus TaxID=2652445 RepID=UPI0035B500EE